MKRSVKAKGTLIEYELVQTDRRDLSLRVTKDGYRLYAPRRAKLRLCDDFVADKSEWLSETRRQLMDYDKKYTLEHPLISGARLMYGGELITLDIVPSDAVSVIRSGNSLIVRSPNSDRESLRETIKGYMREQARRAIDESMRKYAPIVGKSPKTVRLKEQKTRWGSCSGEGNINLNWKLVMAPRQSLDYVVAHELCHLYELNHSKMFWRRVKSVMPDYEYWKKWLKDNGSSLGI